jgi:uncharacterized membrane-anchored protein YjiN (DUF445 family)
VIATIVDVLASGNHAQVLVDQLIQFGREQLERKRDVIRDRIRERSPWWLPKFVDEEIYDQLVGELERILNDIGDDPQHPARAQLNERLRSIKHALGNDAELIARGESLRNDFLDHPATRLFAADVWLRTRQYLHEALADHSSVLRSSLELELAAVGQTLAEDAAVRERLNRWLTEGLIYLVENHRETLSEIISDTVARWDGQSTARRIELHIGRDLQFIRINGTLVGGLVGVALYFAWQVFAA